MCEYEMMWFDFIELDEPDGSGVLSARASVEATVYEHTLVAIPEGEGFLRGHTEWPLVLPPEEYPARFFGSSLQVILTLEDLEDAERDVTSGYESTLKLLGLE